MILIWRKACPLIRPRPKWWTRGYVVYQKWEGGDTGVQKGKRYDPELTKKVDLLPSGATRTAVAAEHPGITSDRISRCLCWRRDHGSGCLSWPPQEGSNRGAEVDRGTGRKSRSPRWNGISAFTKAILRRRPRPGDYASFESALLRCFFISL